MEVELENNLNSIKGLLIQLKEYGNLGNKAGEFGINRIAENIVAGLLNIIYDWNLENLNVVHNNYIGVDLGDKDKKVAVQVAFTEKYKEKLKETLLKIKNNEIYKEYDHLYFFSFAIDREVFSQKTADKITDSCFKFDVNNVITITDIYKKISDKSLDDVCKVRSYLEQHLIPKKDLKQNVFLHKPVYNINIGHIALIRGSIVTLICFLIITTAIVSISYFISRDSAIFDIANNDDINNDFDDHLLLELSNADHQYNEGLNNWKRLDYSRAERDILATREKMSEYISQNNIDVARINNSLGCLYLDMGKYETAYDYLNRALVTFKEVYNDTDIEVRTVMFSIAQYDFCVGNYERAAQTAQSIIDLTNEENEKTVVSSIEHFRAMIYVCLGNYNNALSIYQRVLSSLAEILNDEKLNKELVKYTDGPSKNSAARNVYNDALKWYVRTLNNMGETYIFIEQYDSAKEVLKNAIKICADNVYLGVQNLTASKLYMNLAVAESKLNESKEAIEHIDLAMRIQKKLFDYTGNYPGLVEVYNVYVELLLEENDYDNAKRYADAALTLAIDAFGENHPQTASAYNNWESI